MKKLKIGKNKDMTNEEYHADREYISSSGLKLILKDPDEYYRQYVLDEKSESKMKLTKIKENQFEYSDICSGCKKYSLNEVRQLIKEGYELDIEDNDGNNITKELFIEIAFKKKNDIRNYLEHIITLDQLIELIESGGADNWLSKRWRGF